MVWSWMGVASEWTSPSQKDLTPQHLAYTWADPHTVEVVPAALADIPVTTTVENAETAETVETVDTIAGMTEAAMIAMTKGITTDHTENALLRPTTEGRTDPGQGHGLILHAAIE